MKTHPGRLLPLLAFLLSMPLAAATTRTWTGAVNNDWTVGGNWVGGVAPVAGDDLLFPVGAANLTNFNGFPAGTAFNSVTVNDVNYLISGSAVLLTAGISAPNGGHVLFPITLAASQAFSAGTAGLAVGSVNLNGKTLTLSSASGLGLAGDISGSGTIIKNGAGGWVFNGNDTFTGQLIIDAGLINALSANALGVSDNTLANGTVVNAGGTLALNGLDPTATEYIQLFGSGSTAGIGALHTGGGQTLAGTVELADSNVALSGGSFTFNGAITGAGRFGMKSGTFILMNPANNFAGGVAWLGAATLTLGASQVLPSTVSLDVIAGGVFNVNGKTQTIASLSGAGATQLGSGGALTITNPAGTYSGAMTGSGAVVMSGGTSTWSGTNTYTGTFTHTGGSFTLGGGSLSAALTQSAGTLAISSGATAGVVTVNGGTFAPGAANTGNLTFAPAATYSEAISGTSASSFGNVHVAGAVTLGNAALTLTGSGAGVVAGNTFVIIDNDGTDPVAGTFAGLADGALIVGGPGGFAYRINYAAGTGNDVVLTAIDPGAIPALDPRALMALGFMLAAIALIALRR